MSPSPRPAAAGGERGTVALPMYDLPEVGNDLDRLWAQLRHRLVDDVADLPEVLDRPADLHRSWQRPDLVLSQTCGYPLVGALAAGHAGHVHVVGTFTHRPADRVSPRPRGHYRSVIVARRATAEPDARQRWPRLRAAVNGPWSLSGWISLLASTGTRDRWPGGVTWTGSHRASLAALRSGAADIASVDSVTYGLIRQHAPVELDGIEVVGHGATVPALPLITARPRLVGPLRAAITATLADSDLEPALRALRITGFVPLGRDDYQPVARLARAAVTDPPPWP